MYENIVNETEKNEFNEWTALRVELKNMNEKELELEERKVQALEKIAKNVETLARFIEESELKGIPIWKKI